MLNRNIYENSGICNVGKHSNNIIIVNIPHLYPRGKSHQLCFGNFIIKLLYGEDTTNDVKYLDMFM